MTKSAKSDTMIKDLAILIRADDSFLVIQAFMDCIERLEKHMG